MELDVNRVLAGLLAGLVTGGAGAQVLGLGVGVGTGAGGSVSISVPLPQAARTAARAPNARTGGLQQQAPVAGPTAAPSAPAAAVVLQPEGAAAATLDAGGADAQARGSTTAQDGQPAR